MTSSAPGSDFGALATPPAEPIVEDGGEDLGNSSGRDEEELMSPRVASLELVVPMTGLVR